MGPPGDSVTSQAVIAALAVGPTPTVTRHANAGIGSTHTVTGNRIRALVFLTTGTSPVSGGTLFTIALADYTGSGPGAWVNARDEQSAATFPFVHTTASLLTLRVAGELEPGTTYTYDILVLGF